MLTGVFGLAQCFLICAYAWQNRSVEYSGVQKQQFFIIAGAVRVPGEYRFEHEFSLLELITSAGGLNDGHGPFIHVFRPVSERTRGAVESGSYVCIGATTQEDFCPVPIVGYELIRVHSKAISKNEFSSVLKLKSGSIVNVPHEDVVFVSGDVSAPGPFPYKGRMTLREAILLAGNTLETAVGYAAIYGIDAKSGAKIERKVDLGSVMRDSNEDIAISADDIISIPNQQSQPSVIPLAHLVNLSHHVRSDR